jgi:hypothetical protein
MNSLALLLLLNASILAVFVGILWRFLPKGRLLVIPIAVLVLGCIPQVRRGLVQGWQDWQGRQIILHAASQMRHTADQRDDADMAAIDRHAAAQHQSNSDFTEFWRFVRDLLTDLKREREERGSEMLPSQNEEREIISKAEAYEMYKDLIYGADNPVDPEYRHLLWAGIEDRCRAGNRCMAAPGPQIATDILYLNKSHRRHAFGLWVTNVITLTWPLPVSRKFCYWLHRITVNSPLHREAFEGLDACDGMHQNPEKNIISKIEGKK